jgi:hypothetical protein
MAEGDLRLDLIERQQRRAEAEVEHWLIAQAIGLADDETVEDLQMAGFKADTIVLVELALPVQVAWADGSVSTRERELLLEIAAREHVERDSPAHAQLRAWLESPPSSYLFDASVRAISRIVASLQPEVGAALRRKLINDCATLVASEHFRNWGLSVSNEEQQMLHRITMALT